MTGAQGIPQSSELAPGPGFRIRSTIERTPQDILERLASIDIALVSDLMNRLYTVQPGIRPIVPTADGTPLIGPACTVKVYPGDNLMVHAALDFAAPGDVVIIDTAGTASTAVLGDMVTNKARARGISGFVVDGLVRDLDGMLEAGVPVYARGLTPRGPLHRGPGELNYTVSIGGVSVNPGDVVMAGAEGVVIVPRDGALWLVERAEMKTEKENDYVAAVKRGEFSNQWVTDMLDAHGCQIE